MSDLERVGALVSIRKGRRPPKVLDTPFDGSRRLLQIDDLRPDARRKYISAEPSQVTVEETDIVMAWDGAHAGLTSFGLSGVLGSTLAALSVRSDAQVHAPYLGWFLRANHSYLRNTAKGSAVPHVNPSALANLRLRLPSMTEQRRIAAILDRAESQGFALRRSLAQLDELSPSIFDRLFGATRADLRVADVAAAVRTGPFGSQLLHEEFVESGVAVLGLDNVVGNRFRSADRRFITPEKYGELRRYTVFAGDVLISIMGTVGRCVIVPPEIPTSINTKHICAITADPARVDPTFLRAAFLWHPQTREHLRRQTKGSVMDGLNMGIIKSMPIPLPELREQQKFAEQVSAIDAQRDRVQRAVDLHDELFASLQSRAFRGEL